VSQLLRVILNGRRPAGHLELEATEILVRSAMHHAGATVLTKLLQFPAPATDQTTIACGCGHSAHYRELRSKPSPDRGGHGGGVAALLLVPALSSRPLPRRCRTGH